MRHRVRPGPPFILATRRCNEHFAARVRVGGRRGVVQTARWAQVVGQAEPEAIRHASEELCTGIVVRQCCRPHAPGDALDELAGLDFGTHAVLPGFEDEIAPGSVLSKVKLYLVGVVWDEVV